MKVMIKRGKKVFITDKKHLIEPKEIDGMVKRYNLKMDNRRLAKDLKLKRKRRNR